MASNVDKYLDTGEHAVIDHTGLPGVGAGGGTITGEVVPAGVIMSFGGTIASVPSGYLPCDGSVVAQATYPALFTAVGTTWDTGGEGGGNFRLPDFRGKSPVGLNDGSLPAGVDGGFTTRTLAALGGAETDNVAIPIHNHNVNISDPGHDRRGVGETFFGNATATVGSNHVITAAGPDQTSSENVATGISATTDNTGSGSGNHNTMQPFAVVAYIIKAEAGSPTVSGIGSDTLPTGTITSFAGTVAAVPVGFLPCDGSLADETVEAELFAVIGATWNLGGEPGGFFRLPDLRGKSLIGLNDGSLPNGADGGFTTRTLSTLGGVETIGNHDHVSPLHPHSIPAKAPGTGGPSQTTEVQAGTGVSVASTLHTHDTLATNTDGSAANIDVGGTHGNMHPFATCAYIIKSKQVGGGVGLTAQNNGGALQGAQPTLNFIPSGGAGVTVLEDVGNNRIDITISAPTGGGFTSVSVPRNRTGTGTAPSSSTLDLNLGGTGGVGLIFVLAVLGWDDANNSVSIGVYDGTGTPTSFALAFERAGGNGSRVSADVIGMTQDAATTAILDDNNGAGGVPRIERSIGTGLFHGFGFGLRLT